MINSPTVNPTMMPTPMAAPIPQAQAQPTAAPALKFGLNSDPEWKKEMAKNNEEMAEINKKWQKNMTKENIAKLTELGKQSSKAAAEFCKTKIMELALNAPLPKAYKKYLEEMIKVAKEIQKMAGTAQKPKTKPDPVEQYEEMLALEPKNP